MNKRHLKIILGILAAISVAIFVLSFVKIKPVTISDYICKNPDADETCYTTSHVIFNSLYMYASTYYVYGIVFWLNAALDIYVVVMFILSLVKPAKWMYISSFVAFGILLTRFVGMLLFFR